MNIMARNKPAKETVEPEATEETTVAEEPTVTVPVTTTNVANRQTRVKPANGVVTLESKNGSIVTVSTDFASVLINYGYKTL